MGVYSIYIIGDYTVIYCGEIMYLLFWKKGEKYYYAE